MEGVLVLDLQRELSVPPALAFALVSEPDRMNRWSEARVERVLLGDGAHPGGTGAIRRVRPRIAGREVVLEEVIERSEPPGLFAYRVLAGGAVEQHRGTITIVPGPRGSSLRWRVEAKLALAPMEWAAKAAIRPSLERSLDAMARVALEIDPREPLALPPLRALDEVDEARQVRPAAERCLERQQAYADRLLGRGDDRGWFARVYQHVTQGQLDACAAGVFDHPAWVLRLVCAFDALWEENLAHRLGERSGDVEPHWARAHRAAERAARHDATTYLRAMRSIRAGMRAHIEDDLPRAIAKVHLTSYAGRADVARFRADYLRMSDLFVNAADQIAEVLPRAEWPWDARALDAITPARWKRELIDRRFYPIASKRREAFERAVGLVRVLGSP